MVLEAAIRQRFFDLPGSELRTEIRVAHRLDPLSHPDRRVRRSAERSAGVAARRLHPEPLDIGLFQKHAVHRHVQGHASGEAEIPVDLQLGLKISLDQPQGDLFQIFLRGSGDMYVRCG